MAERRARRFRALPGAILVTVLVACGGAGSPTPVPAVDQSPDPFIADLQPLDVGMTWWYEAAAAPDVTSFVNTVIGDDKVGERPVRLLQLFFADAFSIRLACYVADGDVMVAAVDRPGAGGWQRTVLDAPQLFRPRAGVRTWTQTFPAGVGLAGGTWQQVDAGQQEVLGTARATWSATREIRTETTQRVQQELRAEKVGLVQLRLEPPAGASGAGETHDLYRTNRASLDPVGVYGGQTPAVDGTSIWAIDFSAQPLPRLVSPLGDTLLSEFTSDASGASFTASAGGRTLSWTGRTSGAGLSGLARVGEEQFVLDLRPYPDVSLPEASASPSPVIPG